MKLSEYFRLLKEEEIARRYFITNSFDGALTILGIVIATYLAGKQDAGIVIITSLGAAIAIAISGVWGTYSVERAERLRHLKELEMHLLSDLGETEVEKKLNIVTVLVALVNGLSPLFVSLIIISPFFASTLGLIDVGNAFYASIIIVVILLFILGFTVGHIANESKIKSGINMLLAGVAVTIFVYVLEFLRVL